MWEALRPVLQSLNLDPQRVENGLGCGTPDVNYCEGWLELKRIEAWPARGGVVNLDRLEPGQVAWLLRRWLANGAAFLMLRVGRELLLFDGWTTRQVRQGRDEEWLRAHSCWRSLPDGRITAELQETLRQWLELDMEAMEPRDRARCCRLMCRYTVVELAAQMDVDPAHVLSAELHGEGIVDDILSFWES
jgi:hypothetical protein